LSGTTSTSHSTSTIASALLTYVSNNQSGRSRRSIANYQPEFWGSRAIR
jgi:hypothetical protein